MAGWEDRADPVVDLLVPIKTLSRAKSRLRGAADDGRGEPRAHARLALALARDTVAAASAAHRVRRVVVISSDPEVASTLGADGTAVLVEGSERGLNPALEYGARVLRADAPPRPLGALQADLPALRTEELDAALAEALALFATDRARRAFCADAEGEGTTLLLCAARAPLQPLFGGRSAARHLASGAVAMDGPWAGLRRDVDTTENLHEAALLGLGPATAAVLDLIEHPRAQRRAPAAKPRT
ncbi:MAG: 2-phospho-L-lactate guanylyltransferase [Pseudonocardia sp.]|nr:2-phospho-L-lactate guanylyltransferase [Pseudonocardia sp.]